MNGPNLSAVRANAYSVSLAKMQLGDMRSQGQNATKLIESAGEVSKHSNRAAQKEGLGRRVDVRA